jgi:2-hydroxychromene-2-carboxylate isomerase
MSRVELFYDFGSPTSYLAWVQLPRIAARTGAEIVHRPILLGGILKATGNRSPAEIPAKGRWMAQDLQRFAARYAAPFRNNPHFPVNTLPLMRGAVAAEREGRLLPYSDAMVRAMWVEARDCGDPAVFDDVVRRAGFEPGALRAASAEPAVKERLKAATEEAVARGAFGAPTMFVGDEMFFGQDRLDFVEEALRRG